MTTNKKERSVDITDEFVEWPLKDFIKLLTFLEKNGYTVPYFDGYDAALYLIKPEEKS